MGAANVAINGRPALRLGDAGVHGSCCGPNIWKARSGSGSVQINGLPLHRRGDATSHCGGDGKLMAGSANVVVGGGSAASLARFSPASQRLPEPALALARTGKFNDLWFVLLLNPDRIIEGLKDFRHGFFAGLASLVGKAAMAFAGFYLGKLVGLLDHVLTGLGSLLKYVTWLLTRILPPLKDLLVYVEVLLSNLVGFLLEGGWNAKSIHSCPKPSTVAPVTEAVADELTMSDVDTKQDAWTAIPLESDISSGVYRLIERYRPEFVIHPDDHSGISMDELLLHARLTPLPPGVNETPRTLAKYAEALAKIEEGQGYHLDIDDDYAKGFQGFGPNTYYARARKVGEDEIWLDFFAIRAGSFFVGKTYIDMDFWEHEGDGESCSVILRRHGVGHPWLLVGCDFNGAHVKAQCRCDGQGVPTRADALTGYDAPVETLGARPVVYVAIGSHAMSGESGSRDIGLLIFLDHYPENTAETRKDYTFVTTRESYVAETVFTTKVKWGKDKILFTKNYPGHASKEVVGVKEEDLW